MNSDIAKQILAAVDMFSEPINLLAEELRKVEDDQLRSLMLASLGEVMGILENQIGRKARKCL